MLSFITKFVKITLLSIFLCTTVNAVELRPLAQFDFSSIVTIKKRVKDVKEEKEWDSDPVYIAGLEFIYSAEFSPIHYGFGLGFKSPQKESSHGITPAFIPIWGNFSFGTYHKDWFARPYVVVRAGTMAALTGAGSWWELPLHFFVDAGAGFILPYNIGLEVNYDYSTVQKSFEHRNTKFRISSGRLGLQLSIGFQLTHERKYSSN
jgi:hypothetical protein